MVFKISRSRMDAGNGRVDNVNFKQYGETTVSAGTSATYTVNLATGNSFKLTLTSNCAITFANPLAAGTANIFTIILVQDGGSRGVTWPAAVKWPSGTAPTLATAAGAIDTITFMTVDGGTRYFGFPANGTTTALAASSGYNLFAWGNGARGGLGLNSGTTSFSSPIQIGTLTTWSAVSGGGYANGAAVRTDGSLWTWGNNVVGESGTSDTVYHSSPTQVGALRAWASVSGGENRGFFLNSDGTLWSVGNNNSGALGTGGTYGSNRSSPIQIGTLATWAAISSGKNHNAALKTDGTIWAWGYNAFGSLGLSDGASRSSPVQIGTLATWASVAVGTRGNHTLALKTDGTLWAWGKNNLGNLGLTDIIHRSSPVQVGTLATWSKIAGGGAFSAAVSTNGTLWTWGQNNQYQLAQGSGVYRSSPTQVGTLTIWSTVGAAAYSLFAIKSDNTLWSAGANNLGQLGLGDTTSRSSPVQITSATGWVRVAGGGSGDAFGLQDLSLRTGRSLWTWGVNSYGQLGMSDVVNRSVPTQVAGKNNWSGVSGGQMFRVGVQSDGTIWAWGKNDYGQQGLGDTVSRSSPTQIGTLTTWSKVFTSNYGTPVFAIKTDGTLWAWGSDSNYGLGIPQTGGLNRSSPVQVGTLGAWSQVSSGRFRSALAVKTDGTLWAWGNNPNGQLGLANTTTTSSPTQVGTLTTWASVSVSSNTAAAIRTDGTLWVCGTNGDGQLGMSDAISRSSPTQIGTLATWTQIATTGVQSFVARKTDGTLWSWGRNTNFQLGLGDSVYRSSPTQIGTLTTWAGVSSGFGYMSFARQNNGTLWAWGSNSSGALGLGGGGSRSVPTQIGAYTDWVSPSGTVQGNTGGHYLRPI